MRVNVRTYCKTVGLPKENILGRTDYDLYPTYIADQYSKYDQKVIDSNRPVLGIEEHGRYHFKDRLNFCYYARGSLEETKSWLSKAERRNLIPKEQNHVKEIVKVLPKKLNAYIGSIKNAQKEA